MAAETTTRPVSREVLEDRYNSLVDDPDGDPRKLQLMLWRAYERILDGLVRDSSRQEGDSWGGHDLIAELDAALRDLTMRRVHELGIAKAGRER